MTGSWHSGRGCDHSPIHPLAPPRYPQPPPYSTPPRVALRQLGIVLGLSPAMKPCDHPFIPCTPGLLIQSLSNLKGGFFTFPHYVAVLGDKARVRKQRAVLVDRSPSKNCHHTKIANTGFPHNQENGYALFQSENFIKIPKIRESQGISIFCVFDQT